MLNACLLAGGYAVAGVVSSLYKVDYRQPVHVDLLVVIILMHEGIEHSQRLLCLGDNDGDVAVLLGALVRLEVFEHCEQFAKLNQNVLGGACRCHGSSLSLLSLSRPEILRRPSFRTVHS